MNINMKRIEKGPQQIDLDFSPAPDRSLGVSQISKPKAYLDYSYNERVRLLNSIRAKRGIGELLTDEEQAFQRVDEEYWRGDDQPYKH
jgi:hypothetical protein